LLAFISLACGTLQVKPYEEVFDLQGKWGSGSSAEVEGQVRDGKYELLVKSNSGLYLASAGQNFDNAIYEVEATQVDGPLNNGFGMLFRVDDSSDSFYGANSCAIKMQYRWLAVIGFVHRPSNRDCKKQTICA
jgi:hypothetical protein